MGEKNGIIDTQKAKVEFGLRITVKAMYKLPSAKTQQAWPSVPPSCVVVTIEPISK
jgi:hypothetical protein